MATVVVKEKKYWKCPECGRHFERQGQRHSCKTVPPEFHFRNKEKEKLLYTKLLKAVKREVGPFDLELLRCCIHLVNPSAFAAVKVMRNKIRVDFTLPNKLNNPRLHFSVQVSAHRYLYYVDIAEKDEIDEELIAWIREAWHREKKQPAAT